MFPLHASKSASDSALIFVSTVKCNLLKRERRVHYIYPHFYSSRSLSLMSQVFFCYHFSGELPLVIIWGKFAESKFSWCSFRWRKCLDFTFFPTGYFQGQNFGRTVLSLSRQTLRLGSLPLAAMFLRRNLLYVKRLSPGCSMSFLSHGPEESSFVYFSEAWSSGL